jgi:hypothetical protein
MQGERHKILNGIFAAKLRYERDPEKLPELLEMFDKQEKFNFKYSEIFPKDKITNENLAESYKEGKDALRRSYRGTIITPHNRIAADVLLEHSHEAANKREHERLAKEAQ